MKRFVLAAALALAAPFAQAAPPTTQQVDALMASMDMASMVDGMFGQMEQSIQQTALSMLPAEATEADRAQLKRVLGRQEAMLREEMSWAKLSPIYRRIYMDVFSAEEVEAMTRFYASTEGRGILQKMPLAMGRTMQEMQPIMQSLMQRSMADLEDELGRNAPGK
ncbi:MAG TPA: DUF2059 domain-containing protein [Lysobacter sp.]|nr:DUF2059 domain-containing protein [Lysobacter sp.]